MRRGAVVALVIVAVVGLWIWLTSGRSVGPAGAPRTIERPKRVLLIGVDGLDWDRTERLVAEDRMPNVGSLMRAGASGVLRSIYPYKSPSIWTSIATGKTEEKHGTTGFLAYRPGAENDKLASSNLVRARTLWQILSDADRTVGVIGWLVTYPATPVNGYLVSSHSVLKLASSEAGASSEDLESLRDGVCPPDLWDEVVGLRRGPDRVAATDLETLLATPAHLEDGKPLTAAFADGFLERYPVEYVESYEVGDRTTGGEEPIESPVDEEVKEMLRSLGYIN